jgi:hypothetical protein
VTLNIDPLTINDKQDTELVRLANVFHDMVRETFPEADVDLKANNFPNGSILANSVEFTIVTNGIAYTQKITRHMIEEAVSADDLMRVQAGFCVGRIKRMLGRE